MRRLPRGGCRSRPMARCAPRAAGSARPIRAAKARSPATRPRLACRRSRAALIPIARSRKTGSPVEDAPRVRISDFDAANSLVELFLKRADELGERPFLTAKRDGAWQSLSWRRSAEIVCLMAEALRGLGLEHGERVMLVSENRPEWALADLAIMAAGCITTPAYVTNTERDHAHILENSGAKAVIVSDRKLDRPLLPAIIRTGIAEHVIAMEPLRTGQGPFESHLWDDLLAGDAAAARRAVDARVAGIVRRDPACIIYTSGTSGAPRGVLLHHGAILRNVAGAGEVLAGDFRWGEGGFLSLLPLRHARE